MSKSAVFRLKLSFPKNNPSCRRCVIIIVVVALLLLLLLIIIVIIITFAGSEIAPSWSPMRPKIQLWRPEFHSWSPAGDLVKLVVIVDFHVRRK